MNHNTKTSETNTNNFPEKMKTESAPKFDYEVQGWFSDKGQIVVQHTSSLKSAIKLAEKLIARKGQLAPDRAQENEAEGFDDSGVMIIEHLSKTLFTALIRKRFDIGWCYKVDGGSGWAPVENFVHG